MKVGIIGYGFVGKALADGLKENVDVFLVDPKLKTSIKDLQSFNPKIIFICVPTPMNNDGSQNISILEKVLNEITYYLSDVVIVLKSTVLPSYVKQINEICSSLILNPEFLRENFAYEDFINSDLILFGGDKNETKVLSDFYINHTKCKNKKHIFVDILSASLIKYTINSFLATKVIFFNEIKNIFDKSDTSESWSNFIKAVSSDNRIGDSHMEVPGPDGRYGFGGACFPKDTNALYKYSKEIGAEFELLYKAIHLNNIIRAEYNSPINRELEQNIDFNKDLEE
jgi:nucleotide sugar dehydrogenase